MSVIRSFGKGLGEALIRLQSVFVLWAVNAVFAFVVYMVAAGWLAGPLGQSLSGDAALSGRGTGVLLEILAASGPGLTALITVALALLAVYQLVTPFLYGGVLSEVVRPREAQRFAASFWSGGGKYYGRFFRLSLISLLLWAPAAAVFVVAGKALAAAKRTGPQEKTDFILLLVRIGIALFLFFLVKMVMDYARIRIAVTEGRSALAALGWAVVFTARRLLKTLSLYYLLGLTALAGTAVYWAVQSSFGRGGTAPILAGLALAQAHILWRCWIKVAFQAAEVKLYALENGL